MFGSAAVSGVISVGANVVSRVLFAAKGVDKPFYRYMSQEEATAVRDIKLLRGGREVSAGKRVTVHMFYANDYGTVDEATANNYLDNPKRSHFLIGSIQLQTPPTLQG